MPNWLAAYPSTDLNKSLFDFFLGGSVPRAGASGAFQGLPQLGGELQKYLLQRLQTPATESQEFKLGSAGIRDALETVSGAARQRLGDTATASGYLDSGVVRRGLTDIDRAELQSFSGAIRDLILGLEDRRSQGVLPYLAAGSGEQLGVSGQNIQAALGQRSQNLQFIQSLLGGALTGGFI